MTTEERLKEMGLWDRYQDIQQKTPEQREALIAAGTPGQTSANELEEAPEFKLNEPEVKQQDLTTANGFRARQKAEADAEVAERERILKEEEARVKEESAAKKKWYQAQDTKEEKQAKSYEELGIKPDEYIAERKADIAELEGIWESYNNKVAERDAAVAQITGRTGQTIAFAGAEAGKITNKYNVEINRIAASINTKNAIMAQKQGLMDEARSFAQEAVSNYVYDFELQYNQFEQFEEENRELLDDLKGEYKTALQEQKDISYTIWKETEAEKTQVMDLKLNNAQAGIEIEDTLEEAVEKVSKWQLENPEGQGLYTETQGGFEVLRDSAGNMISTRVAGTTKEDVGLYGLTESESDSFNDAIKIGQNALESGKDWGTVWNEIKDKYPSVPNNIIDNSLGGGVSEETGEAWGWAKGGAFESTQKVSTPSKSELESAGWAWLGTDEAMGLSDEEKVKVIMSKLGLDPETFGLYR